MAAGLVTFGESNHNSPTMSEKEIVRPKRKKESSASKTEENTIVKKAPAAENIVVKTVSENAKAAPVEKAKPARKTKAAEKFTPETEPKTRKTAAVKNTKTEAKAKPATKKIKKTESTPEQDALKTISTPEKIKSKTLSANAPHVESKAGKSVENAPQISEIEKTVEDALQATRPAESAVFKKLAAPKMPQLAPENRARLQMQSPTRIFFYWSTKNNPFETLMRAFAGHAEDFALVAKLQNLTDGTEQVFPVENSGSSWFDVESGAAYRMEVGFFAPARPFVRLMFSNSIETPRPAPSPRRDSSQAFTVSAHQFAEALDASGYAQDAFEAQLSGDDSELADRATFDAFGSLTNQKKNDLPPKYADELRRALVEMAGGSSLENLRGRISARLFARIEAIMQEDAASFGAEKVLAALQENFDFDSFEEGENFQATVFGASSVNFPKKFRRPKPSPISSFKFSESYR